MVGSGAKKAQKILGDCLLSPCPLLSFFFTPFFFTPLLLSEHLDQDTDLGEQFQINLSILLYIPINQFIVSSKALSCMVPYLFRGMVYFSKSFLNWPTEKFMWIFSNIFCSVSSFMLKHPEL